MISFSGKVAIVTGATKGIGKAIADMLAQGGCHVIYTGTKDKKSSSHSKGEYWTLDLSDDDSVAVFLGKVGKLKRVDILVNNAGINKIEPIDEVTDSAWERILKINLTGTMKLMRDAVKVMKKNRRGGKILNISSIFGITSREKRNSYSASKAGMIGLTRASALDLAPFNILVNALCPGFVLTNLTKSILSARDIKELSSEIPLGRFGREEEIAKAAVFLCSDLNTYITGQSVIVDGGYTIK